MKTLTITVDLKSICIGALSVLSILLLTNFNNADKVKPDAADEVRRYQAVSSERGFIILDTKTGQYIIDKNYGGQLRWIKGDFTSTHGNGSGKTE